MICKKLLSLRSFCAPRSATAALLESLEGRRLLSGHHHHAPRPVAVPPPVDPSGKVVITGAAGDDVITVYHDAANAALLDVNLNGQLMQFNNVALHTVEIHGGAGNDKISAEQANGAITQSMVFFGDDGNDTLVGGNGSDFLYGSRGNDSLIGQRGNDLLDGGKNNDDLFGNAGNDTLLGDVGDDNLNDNIGSNLFNGGDGTNRVNGAIQGPSFFLIGAFSQQAGTLWKWASRGINTAVGYESEGGSVSSATWDAKAQQYGLKIIRQPVGNLKSDASTPDLLAWMLPDEPDVHNTNPSVLLNAYAAYKKAAPGLPVFQNFSGGHVVGWQDGPTSTIYGKYLKATDWSASDIYPVTGWNQPGRLDLPALAVKNLSSWSGGKPQFAFIETSNQHLSWLPANVQGSTADQFRDEIWQSVIGGAQGVIYFSQSFDPFRYDSTPPDVEAEMIKQDALLKDLSPVILSQSNPPELGMKVTGNLKAMWRTVGGKNYYFVLNASDTAVSSAKITLGGLNGATSVSVYNESRTVAVTNTGLRDTFAPHELHIYVAGQRIIPSPGTPGEG